MNRKTCKKYAKHLALGLAALAIAATPSFAQTSYDLCATTGTVTMPDSSVIPIWGYADITGGGACALGLATLPGPELRAVDGGTLTINLHNALPVNVSLFIPGYRATVTGGVAGLFTDEAAAGGGTATYDFAAKAGTYLYHSGSDITTQVPMGLYGALVVDVAAGQAYSDVAYDQDQVLVYSAIDADLNSNPGGSGGARVINWDPQYYLINGVAHPATADVNVNSGEDVLLRFVNAGLDTVVPTLDGGLYMSLKAEDGNRYPQPLVQYGIELQAGKTIDAMINAGTDGTYAFYDRAASYDSGVTNIVAGAVAGAPSAVPDAYPIDEDVILTADGILPNPAGVLANDLDADGINPIPATYEAALVSSPSAGVLTLNADGSFAYAPNADSNGVDIFSYKAVDTALTPGPDSNVTSVTISVAPVNDAPVAAADAYDAEEGATLSVAAPGVLSNDSDIDGDALTASVVGTPVGLVLNADGSFDYTPAGIAGAIETFDYEACDPSASCSIATVTITVVPAAGNIPPEANDDFETTTRNTPLTFSVTANDVDTDGTINVASVVITSGATTTRGGTVFENGDGTVTYSPRRGFRGTDHFTYTVNDNVGATSNVATVSINVVKP